MFIEQGVTPENQFWKYLIGSLCVIGATFIGQIPLAFALMLKGTETGEFPTTTTDIMTALDSNLTLFLLLLSFVFVFPVLLLILKYLHRQNFKSVTTARTKVDWSRIFFSFALWSTISVVSVAISYAVAPNEFVWNFNAEKFAVLLVIAVVMVPLQTSAEEYTFRGYLMQGFGNLALNRWFPLVMTSLIFGLMHIANPEVEKIGYGILPYYIGTGLFLGVITLMDDGMELALGFHAANNLTASLLVTADWTALQSHSVLKSVAEPNLVTEMLIPLLVIYPILLLIFKKRYRWHDWAGKLTRKFDRHGNPVL